MKCAYKQIRDRSVAAERGRRLWEWREEVGVLTDEIGGLPRGQRATRIVIARFFRLTQTVTIARVPFLFIGIRIFVIFGALGIVTHAVFVEIVGKIFLVPLFSFARPRRRTAVIAEVLQDRLSFQWFVHSDKCQRKPFWAIELAFNSLFATNRKKL